MSCRPSPRKKRSLLGAYIRLEQRQLNRFSIISCSSLDVGSCRLQNCNDKKSFTLQHYRKPKLVTILQNGEAPTLLFIKIQCTYFSSHTNTTYQEHLKPISLTLCTSPSSYYFAPSPQNSQTVSLLFNSDVTFLQELNFILPLNMADIYNCSGSQYNSQY